jgi:hypothetical protein
LGSSCQLGSEVGPVVGRVVGRFGRFDGTEVGAPVADITHINNIATVKRSCKDISIAR